MKPAAHRRKNACGSTLLETGVLFILIRCDVLSSDRTLTVTTPRDELAMIESGRCRGVHCDGCRFRRVEDRRGPVRFYRA